MREVGPKNMKKITKILLFLLLVVLLLVVLLQLLVLDANTTVALPHYVKVDSFYWMFIWFDFCCNISCMDDNLSCLSCLLIPLAAPPPPPPQVGGGTEGEEAGVKKGNIMECRKNVIIWKENYFYRIIGVL